MTGVEAPYRTLTAAGRDEFVVQKSRFIGHATPAESEGEALTFLERVRSEYKDASHNCFAYIIGSNQSQMRYSDDGEPGGTAGLPILHVMQAQGIVNAAVVVTRYFGGVLLGAAGLGRAYTRGAVIALAAAQPAWRQHTCLFGLDVPFAMLDRVEHQLKSSPYLRKSAEFAELVTLYLAVRSADEEAFRKDIAVWSDGRLEPILLETSWQLWPCEPPQATSDQID